MPSPSQAKTADQTPDVLIVGGGVIGLSVAWELSQRGLSVTIVDAGQVGRGINGAASWAGAGILPAAPTHDVVDPLDQLHALSHPLHQTWSEHLEQLTGQDTGFRRCGGIHLALSPGELATLCAGEAWWSQHGIDFCRLGLADLRELEPGFRFPDSAFETDFRGAWHLPDDCQIRNPDLLVALRKACESHQVTVREHTQIVRVERARNRVLGVTTSVGTRIAAGATCICCGAWARQLLDHMEIRTGLMPVRGQMLLYEFERPPFGNVINEGNRYLVPRANGQVLVGSIEEEVGFQSETTDEALNEIRSWAERVFRPLSDQRVLKTWSGLRPGSYDGLPYLGHVPPFSNLSLATGHFRSGIHLSCGTAVCMADVITGTPPSIDLGPFRVGRG